MIGASGRQTLDASAVSSHEFGPINNEQGSAGYATCVHQSRGREIRKPHSLSTRVIGRSARAADPSALRSTDHACAMSRAAITFRMMNLLPPNPLLDRPILNATTAGGAADR